MLDKIMSLVNDQVADTVGGIAGIPEDKKAETVETTAGSLMEGLKKYATPENISSLTSMLGLGKSGGAAASAGTSGMSGGLESGVVSALTSKVGLDPAIAQKIASAVIPAVMALFKSKVDDKNEPGFNLESLIGGLSGKSSGGSSGGMMDMLGGILGKK